ncbi:odorant receptor 22c-like isoform X2 [Linepithema humile]|uniref:odorant receptor 22c-like isoform X2 n=1 Tax=Linepithema humile TaxID=83485 RepID=UPI00351F0801
MISLETRYFNTNRILLLILGLWPYKQSLFTRLQLILLFNTLTTYVLFQFTIFLTSKCTLDLILKVFSSGFFFVCIMIKYNSFCVNINTIKSMCEQLQNLYNELKDVNEVAILEKYGSRSKRFTTAIMVTGEIIFALLQIWLHIHNSVLSANKSHPPEIVITEYFIDQEKYFYLITMHRYAAWIIGGFAMVGTGTWLIAYLQHICGMFNIACYRIEQAMTADIIQMRCLKSEKEIHKEIICAIDIHRKAMKYTNFFIINFERSFFFLIASGMVSLCLNLVCIAMFDGHIEQLVLPIVMSIVLYFYLFIANYVAQEITEHNSYVFVTTYDNQWYMAPLNIQKMVLFLLQRGTKSFNVILGGIFVASMESAASLLSASISYCTVLYSTR